MRDGRLQGTARDRGDGGKGTGDGQQGHGKHWLLVGRSGAPRHTRGKLGFARMFVLWEFRQLDGAGAS